MPRHRSIITSLLWLSNRRQFTSASVPATTVPAIMAAAGTGLGTMVTMAMAGVMVEADIMGVDMAMAGIDKRLSEKW